MNELNHPSEEKLNKGCLLPLFILGLSLVLTMLFIAFMNWTYESSNEDSEPEPISYRAIEIDGERHLIPIYDYTNQ